MLNKTKIICTIGTQSENESTLEQMLLAGMNVARLNFSNGDVSTQQRYVEKIRKLSLIHGRPISIMLDTCGPKVLADTFENDVVSVGKGCKVTIYTNSTVVGNSSMFSIKYPSIVNEVKEGDVILANAGQLKLLVLKVDKRSKKLECVTQNSGNLVSHCLINIPHVKTSLPILSGDDIANLKFAINMDVDFIAASFVRDVDDVLQIKKYLEDQNSNIKVYAKIENAIALENFDEILNVADGIVIPRGDLSNEVSLELLPIVQKKMIRKCNDAGKPVIVGTQILSSMTRNKKPSRAEVADVANLVLDGVDALSLSNVTTVGLYPIKSVKMLAKILTATEEHADELSHYNRIDAYTKDKNLNEAVALSVKETAKSVDAKLIVAFSESGATAKRISMLRPNCAIASISSDDSVRKSLALFWGIYPVVSNHPTFEADFVSKASEIATYYGLKEGDTFIITGGNGVGNTNFMKVCKL